MVIWSYLIGMADDIDVLPDAFNSLSMFSDKIFVVDGLMGAGTLCHHPRFTTPLREWLPCRPECSIESNLKQYNGGQTISYHYFWNGVSLTLYENEFRDPAHQRNFILDKMSMKPEQPDWIAMLDADEVFSNEFVNSIRPYLDGSPDDVVGVTIKRYNLIQDERHCASEVNWLAHPRITRNGNHYYSGAWHEHMQINRNKIVKWDVGLIHTRMLYRKRLYVQRGHPNIRKPPNPFHVSAKLASVPYGITWTPLRWPIDEIIMDIDDDASKVWTPEGELIHAEN